MTKTLTGYDVLVYVKVSQQRHLKQCHICIKNGITEQMTLNDSCRHIGVVYKIRYPIRYFLTKY